MAARRIGIGLRYTALGVVGLLSAAALLLTAVLGTPVGTRLALQKVLAFVPGVTAEQIGGTLWRGVTLEGVRFAGADGTEVAAGRVDLAVAWPALLELRLHVLRAEVAGVDVRLPPHRNPPTDPDSRPRIDAGIPGLPLAVRVDALRLRDVTLQPEPGGDTVRLDALDTVLRIDRNRVVVPRLTLRLSAPVQVRLEADARVDTTAPHHLRLHTGGALALPGHGHLNWSLNSEGEPKRLHTSGDIDWQGERWPDATATFRLVHDLKTARIDELDVQLLDGAIGLGGTVGWQDGLDWDLHAAGRDLRPPAIVPWLDGPIRFDLESRGRLDAAGVLEHDSRITDADAGVAGIPLHHLQLHAGGGTTGATIHALALDLLDGRLEAAGQMDWNEGLRWRATVSARGMDPGRLAAAAPGRVGFRAVTSGRLDEAETLHHETRVDDLTGTVAGVPFEALGFALAGDLEKIRIRNLSGRVLDTRVQGGARLTLGDPGIAWSARLSLDDADPARLARFGIDPAVEGRIGLDLASRGAWRDGRTVLDATIRNLRGELDGQALAGGGTARFDGGAVRLQPADLSLGPNRLHLEGTVTPPFDLRYRLTLPDLSRLPLVPQMGLAGRLEGTGRLRGDLDAPDVDADLAARDLRCGDLRLDGLHLKARVDRDRLALDASVDGLAVAGRRMTSVRARMAGTLAAHDLSLSARADYGRLDLALDGGLAQRRWQGRLTRLELARSPAGDWGLERPAALGFSGADFSVDDVCLVPLRSETTAGPVPRRQPDGSGGRICAAASRRDGRPVRATLDAVLPLALARPWLPPAMELPGTVVLKGAFRIAPLTAASVELVLPDSRVVARGWTEDPLSIDYRDVRFALTLHEQGLDARLAGRLPGYAVLDGGIRARLDGERPVSGRIDLEMPEMAWITAFLPSLADLTGRADARITLAGTIGHPIPEGRIRVSDLAFGVPDAGVAYQRGSLRVEADSRRRITLEGGLAGTEGGTLRVTGTGSLADLPRWRCALSVDGEDLPLLRINELALDASPALTAAIGPQAADVRGRIVLPRAEARVERLPEGAVKESPDLVLADRQETAAAGYGLHTDIEVVLGEKVTLEGMGFTAGLAGRLRLRGDPAAPIAAFGEVDIEQGRYTAYGQKLTIDRGRLLFNGPLDDPALDVRASRTVGDYRAGLELGGTLQSPVSRIFAEPPLPESDALSLLLTGRRLSEGGVSGSEVQLLVNALTGLGIRKANDIARDIGQVVGFDEVGIKTENGLEGTELTLGKRINSRLLVRYAVGVFDGVGRFVTEYDINRYLDLEISSSPEAQSGDLIYRIER